MDVLSAVAFGAAGGAIVEVINLFDRLTGWQDARHTARNQGEKLPALALFVDVPADTAAALARFALGALAGLLFHAQVGGAGAAVTVGASAPALLFQLGSRRAAGPLPEPPSGVPQVVGEAAE